MMILMSRTFALVLPALFLCLSQTVSAALEPIAVNVLISKGDVFFVRGGISFSRKSPGDKIRMGFNNRYMGGAPPPVSAWTDPGAPKDRIDLDIAALHRGRPIRYLPKPLRDRPLASGQVLQDRNLLLTGSSGYTKLRTSDGTLLDIGPETALCLNCGTAAPIQLLFGSVRISSAASQKHVSPFLIESSNVLLAFRHGLDHEIVIAARMLPANLSLNEVSALRGQVSVDYPMYNSSGLVFHQTVVVQPGEQLAVEGPHGFGTSVSVRKASNAQDLALQETHPKLHGRATKLFDAVDAAQLPGTFLLPTSQRPPPLKPLEANSEARCHRPTRHLGWIGC
jgi:hypothetical protein